MSGFRTTYMQTKARYILLHPLQPRQARLLCEIQIIFGTVYMAESSLPPTASLLVFHCTVVFVSYNSVMHKVGLFVYPTTNTLTSYDWGAVS